MIVLRKIFYIRWSAGRSPRVHEINPGRDPSLLQEFDMEIKDKKGTENIVADHLSRLEGSSKEIQINDDFSDE